MKSKYLLLLMASALVLGSCTGNNSGDRTASESASESSGSSGSSSQPPAPSWSNAIKDEMQYYAGEILPYAALFASTPTIYQDTTDFGQPYTVLYDDSNTNKYNSNRVSYKAAIEEAGWNAIYDSDEEGEYIYATKYSSDGIHGYEFMYWYGEYGNTMQLVHNFMTNQLTSNTDWTDDEKEIMVTALDGVLPFMKFADEYVVAAYDETSIVIYDFYYQSLESQYATVLANSDFESSGNGKYVLTTSTSIITVEFDYYYGNYLEVYYEPVAAQSATWPLELIEEYTGMSSLAIPAFEISDGASYSYYEHGGSLYIEGPRSTSCASTYEVALLADTTDLLVSYDDGLVGNWHENYTIAYADVSENNAVSGFQIVVTAYEGRETDNDFPYEAIQTAFSSGEVIPTLHPQSVYGFKVDLFTAADQALAEWGWLVEYNYTEQEIIDLFADDYQDVYLVSEYADPTGTSFDSYYADFTNEVDGWFVVSSDLESKTASLEDPTGKLGVLLYEGGNVLTMQFYTGSGEVHLPSLTLSDNTFKGLKDDTLQLQVELQMLSGEVTFTSSDDDVATVDENGLITIVSETLDDTCTITASITKNEVVYSDTCVVTVSEFEEITDALTRTSFGYSGNDTSYTAKSFTSTNTGVTYSGYMASNYSAIQLNDKNGNVGVAAGNGSATCKSISFTFESHTVGGKIIDVYASNEPFTSSSMYGSMTAVAQVSYNSSNPTVTVEFDQEYKYVGFRAHNGAVYLTSFDVTWLV